MRNRLLGLVVGCLAIAALGVPASSARTGATVSGTIPGAKGYTLIAMSQTRIVAVVRLGANGRFHFRAARDLTLQLLRPNHTFFGPVVIWHHGARAYEAFSGRSLNLGTIKFHAGYATPVHAVSAGAVDRALWAYADRAGKPVGAGNLGLRHRAHRQRVISMTADNAGSGALDPGSDPTHSGIVTAFNADVTGSGVPNAENPAASNSSGDGLFTEMMMPLEMSVNADASGVTSAQLSNVVRNDLRMDFFIDGHAAGGAPVSAVSVDCGALPYCATGTTMMTGNPHGQPQGSIWNGTVPADPNRPNIFDVQIAPNVGTDQIHPGDVFLVHYTTPNGDVVVPTTLTLYFLSVPAVSSVDSGSGPQTISYPVPNGAPGSQGNPLQLSSGQITLRLWRPQRAAFPGESGDLYDLGHLHYGIPLRNQAGNQELGCPTRFYSGLTPTLQLQQSSQDPMFNQLFPLHDTADDAPADPASQIGFTLDLAGCLAADGVSATAPVQLPISAVDEPRQGGTDRGVQMLTVCLPGCVVPPGGGSGPGPGPGSAADRPR